MTSPADKIRILEESDQKKRFMAGDWYNIAGSDWLDPLAVPFFYSGSEPPIAAASVSFQLDYSTSLTQNILNFRQRAHCPIISRKENKFLPIERKLLPDYAARN